MLPPARFILEPRVIYRLSTILNYLTDNLYTLMLSETEDKIKRYYSLQEGSMLCSVWGCGRCPLSRRRINTNTIGVRGRMPLRMGEGV
jgi:hypothetical protein